MSIIAIVGSRDFTDLHYMRQGVMLTLQTEDVDAIVSGGQRGADTLSEVIARELEVPHRHIIADWKKYGRAAGPIRNRLVIEACTVLIAFPIGASKGTRNAIEQAKAAGKQVYVYDRTMHRACPRCKSELVEGPEGALCSNTECMYGAEGNIVVA